MSKPTVLMIGAYPEWDMPSLEQAYDLRKLWLAADKEAFLAEAAPDVRAIATRGELGASGALIDRCPKLEIVSCYGVGVDAIDLETGARAGRAGHQYARRLDRRCGGFRLRADPRVTCAK